MVGEYAGPLGLAAGLLGLVAYVSTDSTPASPQQQQQHSLGSTNNNNFKHMNLDHLEVEEDSTDAYAYDDYECVTWPSDGPVLSGLDVVALKDAAENGDNVPPKNFLCDDGTFMDDSLGGYEFWFTSLENLERFQADPLAFAPRYGGFCAFGISGMDEYSTELAAVCMSDASLYELCDDSFCLFRNHGARDLWDDLVEDEGIMPVVETCDANWDLVLGGELDYCFNTVLVSLTEQDCMINDPPPPSSDLAVGRTAAAAGDGEYAQYRTTTADLHAETSMPRPS